MKITSSLLAGLAATLAACAGTSTSAPCTRITAGVQVRLTPGVMNCDQLLGKSLGENRWIQDRLYGHTRHVCTYTRRGQTAVVTYDPALGDHSVAQRVCDDVLLAGGWTPRR